MSPPRILVADDDAWILRMVTTVLEKRGYWVETASDGEEAFEKALENPPDLLITDVMMPKMDGWTLVKALRARPEFAFVPVVFLTALGADDDRIKGFRLGADDYLPKPFRFEELDLRVAKTLKQRRVVEDTAREQLAVPQAPLQGQSSGLAGDLTHIGLSSLLTLLEMERKTGVLTLSHDALDLKGHIYLRQGRIVAARLDGDGQPQNEEAVYHLLSWTSGRFELSADSVERDIEIDQTTTHILMEGARRLDEQEREEEFG
jgi:DNA-binding response OmpR family regulator